MGLVNLEVYPRSAKGKNQNRRLRAAGRVPAVLYGKDRSTDLIELDAHGFGVILHHLGGGSAIFSLVGKGHGKGAIALLKEIQKNPVTDEILHIDLQEIPRNVPVIVPVAVHVTGTCPAVKSGEGSVALTLNHVEIKCLPGELPEFIEVDISDLSLHDKIYVKDITAPVGEVTADPDTLILNIKPAAVFVEEVAAGEEGEEGEAAEGEAAAAEKGAGDGDQGKSED